ncbi:glycine zipper 2TM domain-containing protein [Cognatiluteimonas profundi]|uniref:glycine zipper 2TM domain-containing protein n=1 Tax=Cognatiluteimonas profundi TaxID=2594501 RepID=UPI00131DD202|nr:glycine zipper 2TM domain-containing protein [Lysobacter profundi]
MKVLTASILALGLAASIGTASAQSSGYYSQYGQPQQYGQAQYGQPQQYGQYGQYGQPAYGQPTADRYGQSSGAYYDYARVVRVDPIYAQGYGGSGYAYPANAQQGCVTRQDSYAGNGYNNGYNNGYGNNGYDNTGYRNDGYNNNGYANQGSSTGRTVATVIGGVLGAALGSQVGGGSARYATSAIGTMVGGVVGQKVYENAQRNRYPRTGIVQVCDPVQVGNGGYPGNYTQAGYGQSGQYGQVNNAGISGYDVTYEYGGRTYTTRTSYNPGSRLRVRVAVNPG